MKSVDCIQRSLLWKDEGKVSVPESHGLPVLSIVTVRYYSFPFQPDTRAVLSDSKEQLGPGSVSIPEELCIMYDCI